VAASPFAWSTGTPDLELGVAGKRQFGPVALSLGGSGVRRFPGVVRGIRVQPVDRARGHAEVLLQLGPAALSGAAQALAESGGCAVDARLAALLNLTRGLDVGGWIDVPMAGQTLPFVVDDDVSATRSGTWGGVVEMRY
jgi:hypothetical protein